MSNVSFGNLANTQQLSPAIEQRIQSQENFGAIDKEKLKQDTIEIAKNAHEHVEDNFIFRILKNTFGIEDPKKFLVSAGLLVGTVFSFAALGNKFNKQIIEFSQNIDDIISKNKTAQKIGNAISEAKTKTLDFFKKFKFTNDIIETYKKRKAQPVQLMAKTLGPKGQFAANVLDTVQAIHLKIHSDSFKMLKKNLGGKKAALEFLKGLDGADKAKNDLISKGIKIDTIEDFSQKFNHIQTSLSGFFKKKQRELASAGLINEIKQNLNCNDKEALEIFEKIKQYSTHASSKEILEKSLGKDKAKDLIDKLYDSDRNFQKTLKALIGDNADFDYFYKNFTEIEPDGDRAEFARKLTEAIAQKHNCDFKDKKALAELLEKLKSGELGEDFTLVTMNREGFMSSWLPANIIDSIGSKIFKDKWKPFGKGNLGDALIKFNMADGALATTGAGKVIQKIPLYTAESISNHVADLSTMNLFVTIPALMSLFNSVQDAPKEQKTATLADEFVAGLGNFVFSLPLASSIVYGIATLRNLEGKNPLKLVGKVIGMGLPTKLADGQIKQTRNFPIRFLGGAMRLLLIMFVISPKISNAITKVVQKVFGKPYNKAEAEKLKALEEQKKQVIPELGITQGELMEKMEKNPQAVQKLQTDPKLAQTIAQNPKALLDLLDGKEVKYIEPPKSPASEGKILSPANKNRLNNKTNNTTTTTINNNVVSNTNNTENKTETQKNVDTATYIPSSEFIATGSNLSPEQQSEYDAIMTRADKALTAAEKYI